jgi:tRNA1(Val) A37 N6-methylase TrmN6
VAKRRPPDGLGARPLAASGANDIDGYALGHMFEASCELPHRKDKGIFYTSEILATFLATSALENFNIDEAELSILDPACGAGAFLLAADRALPDLPGRRLSLFGSDLLEQAIEVAKLALAIRSARNGERVTTFAVGDSLDIDGLFDRLGQAPGGFDLVIGNPPWGAQLSQAQRLRACSVLGLPLDEDRDSWELFVALGLHALRPGGRLALVLPDTLLSPEKASTRKLLLDTTTIEKLHNLGPDWFGGHVRMGTVIVQARLCAAAPGDCYAALLLHGEQRRRAIEGSVSLAQLEASLARRIPQARSLASPDYAFELSRDERDDELMQRMDLAGEPLAKICARTRGEEMAKSGLMWKCTSCDSLNNPGTKAKGGGFHSTDCKRCGLTLSDATATSIFLVTASPEAGAHAVPFIDGDDLPGRYKAVIPSRWLALDSGFKLKPPQMFVGPKILLRQAGVGIAATLDESNARCPQSLYVYRVNPEHDGYTNEYVLAVLLSRTMAYYVFKRFGEVDPARAHAKLTHQRLSSLPIPRLALGDARQSALHRQIQTDVRSLLSGAAALGGEADWRIERAIRELYGLDAQDGEYIDSELQALPRSQAINELFPEFID